MTVHVGETVTFAVVTNVTEDDLRWRFNYDKISDSNGKQSLTLAKVRLNQAGIYQCFVNGKRWDAGNAVFLLHVVSKLTAYYPYMFITLDIIFF